MRTLKGMKLNKIETKFINEKNNKRKAKRNEFAVLN
jgi:hypothetical protein